MSLVGAYCKISKCPKDEKPISDFKNSEFVVGSKTRGNLPEYVYRKLRSWEYDEVYVTDFYKFMFYVDPVHVSTEDINNLAKNSGVDIKDVNIPESGIMLNYSAEGELTHRALDEKFKRTHDNKTHEQVLEYVALTKTGKEHKYVLIFDDEIYKMDITLPEFNNLLEKIKKLMSIVEEDTGSGCLLVCTM
ncbi:P21 [Yam asymptomatic virus 1]|uniref:P21 n=1 Tax=Yam asymptomatic virus 1 TaxID=2771210 RepID=A0A7H1JMH8_9CLOS|nr:P21 [Yam asymptomatic virus 1]QNT12725.1 P21 [Yam asymptomatic virus 1]